MNIQTRKTENIILATTTEEMFGKYVAENACRRWAETFVDEATGKETTIERSEVLFSRGTKIDEQNVDSVAFYLESKELEGIKVSDQCRLCAERESAWLKVYAARVVISDKKYKYVCQATNIDMAKAIIADYIELTEKYDFKFLSIGELDCGTILNRDKQEFTKLKAGEAIVKEEPLFPKEEPKPAEELSGDEEEAKKEIRYYEISLYVTSREVSKTAGQSDTITSGKQAFLVEADDADEAKEKCIDWLKLAGTENTIIEEATTLSASPFKCKKVIAREFVETYLDFPTPPTL